MSLWRYYGASSYAICEAKGAWPSLSTAVLVALLPKSTTGRRPIGLFPWLPKIWGKARRSEASRWEIANSRPYLYAGPGKGANIAVWKQAARAEHANALPVSSAFGMSFIDLVKAFDKVPWHLLVQEAIRLGYSLWLLRLSLAAYAAPRLIRIDGTVSKPICPKRSLAAGGGFATTEMRLVMIHLVDTALAAAPYVNPTLYVDDLSVDVAGGVEFVFDNLVRFTLAFCRAIRDNLMEVSASKSQCMASSPKLGRRIAAELEEFGIQFQNRVTSLGGALGAGTRRNVQVLRKRLSEFCRRLPRFRKLAAANVSTGRLLRTGVTSAITYGQAITGVSPSMLLAQRRAAAGAAAPAAGTCGQELNLALLVADGGPRGRADPAYDAHVMPIGEWAEAVWHSRLPRGVLQRIVGQAIPKLANAKSKWQHVKGPGAAMVASAQRIGWVVESATRIQTETGRVLLLDEDPPVVVKRAVEQAVRMWRDSLIIAKFQHLNGNTVPNHGLQVAPIWTVLNCKTNTDNWNGLHKGALRSAIACRQWTQLRCADAGFGTHDKCLLCLEAAKRAESWAAPNGNASNTSGTSTTGKVCVECPTTIRAAEHAEPHNEKDSPLLQSPLPRPPPCHTWSSGSRLAYDNEWSKIVQAVHGEQMQEHYQRIGTTDQFAANCDRYDPGPAMSKDAAKQDEEARRRYFGFPTSADSMDVDEDATPTVWGAMGVPTEESVRRNSGGHPQGHSDPGTTIEAGIELLPIGNLRHRVLDCPQLQPLRDQLEPEVLKCLDKHGIPWQLADAFATGLFPLTKLKLEADEIVPPEGTFQWVLKQEGLEGFVKGQVYTDASRVHDFHPDTMRLGWAFVVLDKFNHVVAIARGSPPYYIDDIPGAEAWALVQATSSALPGSTFTSDCKPCIDAIHAGYHWACTAGRPLARVMKQLFVHIDDVPTSNFVWMPAHTSMANVGVKCLSNGKTLTHTDRRANGQADTEAKAAAAAYTVAKTTRVRLLAHKRVVLEAARWLGQVTWAATNFGKPAMRDSEASKARADELRRKRIKASKTRKKKPRQAKQLRSSIDRTATWTEKAQLMADVDIEAGGKALRKHVLMKSSDVIWCCVCGSFGTLRGRGLARSCTGHLPPEKAGGRAQQLRKLLAGVHPKDGYTLGPAMPQSRWADADSDFVEKAVYLGEGAFAGTDHAGTSNPMRQGGASQLDKLRQRVRSRLSSGAKPTGKGRSRLLVDSAAECAAQESGGKRPAVAARLGASKGIQSDGGHDKPKRSMAGPLPTAKRSSNGVSTASSNATVMTTYDDDDGPQPRATTSGAVTTTTGPVSDDTERAPSGEVSPSQELASVGLGNGHVDMSIGGGGGLLSDDHDRTRQDACVTDGTPLGAQLTGTGSRKWATTGETSPTLKRASLGDSSPANKRARLACSPTLPNSGSDCFPGDTQHTGANRASSTSVTPDGSA